jgi:hypothetical protein
MKGIGGDKFSRRWLLLCEGLADRSLFSRLLEARGMANAYDVRFPGSELYPAGGRGKFGRYLSVAMEAPSFQANTRAVLIVTDADSDRAESLRLVRKSLEENGFPAPENERQVVQYNRWLDIVILVVPLIGTGNLETLALPAAYQKWPMIGALNSFVTASPARRWETGKQSKMRMQAIIAANCEEGPDTGFCHLWQRNERYHLDLNHECFNDVAAFLERGFLELLNAA